MLAYWVLGVGLLAGLLLAGRWFMNAEPKQILKILKWVLFSILVLTIGFMAVTGRLGWALMSLPVLLPWLMRARALTRAAKNFSRMRHTYSGGGSGQTSDVDTQFLRMRLDHDSGHMSGEVIAGPFAGRNLDDLSMPELMTLLGQFAEQDEESAQVLTVYLDRAHPDWREQAGQYAGAGTAGGSDANLTPDQAYQILGLQPGASDEEIREAHKRLIANLHPDKGGSSYLAAQINQAKDVLLGRS
ncbi:MAG: DnaJ domain-containing protein [Rhodospirillales bacterium]